MTRSEFEHEVALATGETIETIRGRGFSLVEVPDLEPLVLDWDEVYPTDRVRVIPRRPRRSHAAA